MVGPSLAGLATTATSRVAAADYHGKATDPAAYIRESILTPTAYLVPGANFSINGQSMMPPNFSQTLEPAQVDALVAYLMTLK